MSVQLENMYAYRFFESDKGPLDTIRKYRLEEIDEMGREAGIVHIREIYRNRVNMENLMFSMFKRNGGKPTVKEPIYFAIYDELPNTNKLHVRFKNPMCLKIPMTEFDKNLVSFTYGLSTHAFTRKDNHPCRRRLLTWEETQEVINTIPFDEKEDIWMEMQVWDEEIITNYYRSNSNAICRVEVEDRLSNKEKEEIRKKYDCYFQKMDPTYYFEPDGLHGILHAMRVVILTQRLADINGLSDEERELLAYCGMYHDIGRFNNAADLDHGKKSFEKIENYKLIPDKYNEKYGNILKFIIENHPYDVKTTKQEIMKYKIVDQELAMKLFSIFRDADILDLCRYGSVNKHYLHFMSSRDVVPFAFQLLLIYREKSSYGKTE